MPLEARENPSSLPFIDRPNVRDSWCGVLLMWINDHRENEKVILLSFIFSLFYI